MPLKLRPITSPSDFLAMARIYLSAFRNNPLNATLYPETEIDPKAMEVWQCAREEIAFSNPAQRIIAVVDTDPPATDMGAGTNRDAPIIAYAKWKVPLTEQTRTQEGSTLRPPTRGNADGSAGAADKKSAGQHSSALPSLPAGANVDLWNLFRTSLDGMRNKHVDSEKEYALNSLVTHPAHQGRGCASRLLKWGIEHADADGARIYLESTPTAHALYLKHGWKDVDEVVLDLTEFGTPAVQKISVMKREPRGHGESVGREDSRA